MTEPNPNKPSEPMDTNHTKALVAAYSLVTADLKQKTQDAEALNKELKAEQQELPEQIRLLKNDGDESQEPSLMDHQEAMESDQRAREIMMDIEAYAASVLAYAEMIKHAQRQQAEFLKTADYQSKQLKAMREAIMEESLSIRKGAAELKKRLQAIQTESETSTPSKPTATAAARLSPLFANAGLALMGPWEPVYGGVQDCNANIMTLTGRYFPAGVRGLTKHTVIATIYMGQPDREFLTATFEDATEAGAKKQVERWAKEQFEKIVNALTTTSSARFRPSTSPPA